ncbi:helix-turn-helix domain-containing protein [Flexivirga meconopsidis]|uniref:helix-turn-helix domain-containing protein n=1 Tax=Flexivirga meconopsidis TaxID=2977121 RepID=UPI00223F024D|nr:helix-turn-helix domain-containing protein [Flexivirga meconopsidis]
MTNRSPDANPPTRSARVEPDLGQLKALAHPVRLRMLGMLRIDGPATASQLAQRLGVNSGATSYHLRQLAEAGLITDDDSRGSKRDRWWKAAHRTTNTEPSAVDDPEERAVLGSYHALVARSASQDIERAAAEVEELPRQWQDLVEASDWNARLTPDQVRRIKDAVHQVLAEGTAQDAETDDAALVTFQFHAFPRPGTLVHPDDDES